MFIIIPILLGFAALLVTAAVGIHLFTKAPHRPFSQTIWIVYFSLVLIGISWSVGSALLALQ